MTTTATKDIVASGNDLIANLKSSDGLASSLLDMDPADRELLYEQLVGDPLLMKMFMRQSGGHHSQSEMVGPTEANAYLDHNYGMQRDFKKSAIALYTEEMRENRWNPDSIIRFVYCKEDQREHLVDGQNRLSAVIASETTQTFLVHRSQVDTLDEVKRIYTNIDNGVNRSTSDMLKVLMFGHDGPLKKIIKGKKVNGVKQADKLVPDTGKLTHVQSALKILMNGGYGVSARTRYRTPMDKLVPLIIAYEPTAAQFYTAIHDSELEHRMDGSSIMAMALLTLTAKPDNALKFWTRVAAKPADADTYINDPSKLSEASPVVQLHFLILNHKIDELNTGLAFRLCARAWNAFQRGKSIASLGGLDPKDPTVQHTEPVSVAGTDFDGRHRVYLELDGSFSVNPLVDPQIEIDRKNKEAAAAIKEQQKLDKAALKAQQKADKAANPTRRGRPAQSANVAAVQPRGHAALAANAKATDATEGAVDVPQAPTEPSEQPSAE